MRIGFLLRFTFAISCILLLNFKNSDGQAINDSLIRSGNRKIESGNFEGARNDFDRVLKTQPSNNAAINGKITVLYSEGNSREAGREVEKAIEKDPGYAEFYFSRAMIANQRRNFRRAIEDFDRALTLQPANNSRIYLNRGITRLNMNDDEAAMSDFTLAIENNPQNTAAYNYRGMINYRNSQFVAAIADFDRIIALDTGNDVAHYNRAMAYLRSGDTRNACADFHNACKLGNRNACQMIVMECQ
jgi:tetratricopeptide (TPR) repeat protein